MAVVLVLVKLHHQPVLSVVGRLERVLKCAWHRQRVTRLTNNIEDVREAQCINQDAEKLVHGDPKRNDHLGPKAVPSDHSYSSCMLAMHKSARYYALLPTSS